MQVLAAVAEFERDLLIERTQAGLQRAKDQGKSLGRPTSLSEGQKAEIRERIKAGESVNGLAKAYATSRQTIMRVRDTVPGSSKASATM